MFVLFLFSVCFLFIVVDCFVCFLVVVFRVVGFFFGFFFVDCFVFFVVFRGFVFCFLLLVGGFSGGGGGGWLRLAACLSDFVSNSKVVRHCRLLVSVPLAGCCSGWATYFLRV